MIKDSGNRTEFASGAVRDVQTMDKGRCDLIPLDVMAEYLHTHTERDETIAEIASFIGTGDCKHFEAALRHFESTRKWNSPTLFLEVAKHFAEGAAKYSERNWEKGIPVSRFVDSGVRHYLKWLRGDTDEPHARAFCWNILCAWWTCIHHPELNEYKKENTDAED